MGEEGITGGYHDSIKEIISSKLQDDLESGQLAGAVSEVLAEGRLKVLATFSDDLSRIKERIEFLKVVKHYLDARKGPAEAKPAPQMDLTPYLAKLDETMTALAEAPRRRGGADARPGGL